VFGAAGVGRVAFDATVRSSQTYEDASLLERLCSCNLTAQLLEPSVLAASPRTDGGEVDVKRHCLIVPDSPHAVGHLRRDTHAPTNWTGSKAASIWRSSTCRKIVLTPSSPSRLIVSARNQSLTMRRTSCSRTAPACRRRQPRSSPSEGIGDADTHVSDDAGESRRGTDRFRPSAWGGSRSLQRGEQLSRVVYR
jgi:hypothetical protein